MIDYRKILIAYIDHIGYEEGIDYLPATLEGLSVAENAELNRCAAEGTCTDEHKNWLLKYAALLEEEAALANLASTPRSV